MGLGRAIEQAMNEADTATCFADRLLEPEDRFLGSFAWIDEGFVFVFESAVRVPGRGEGHDDQESEDWPGDQREQGGLGEGVDVVPFQVEGQTKLS
jgi:hypothetical protein